MSDHDFCRLLLKETRRTLTGEQRKRLVGAWSYNYVGQRDGEFHVTKDDFYWHGSACCAYHARSQGISAWLQRFYPDCSACGERPAQPRGDYCRECDYRIDNGPMQRLLNRTKT